MNEKRVVFDFEIDFSNGGGIQGQDFRLDIEGDDIDDKYLADYIVEDMRLLMVGNVRILNKKIITEKHKRPKESKTFSFQNDTNGSLNIGIYIYNQVEVLDFSGPFEVFTTASRICETESPFSTFLVSENGNEVTARGDYQVIPAFGFNNAPKIDVLIVAGGAHYEEVKKFSVLEWIKQTSDIAKMVASVCTGVFFLAEAGVVTNHSVTTHWEDVSDLQTKFPKLQVLESQRWVKEKEIITSAGISAGIDMSLHLVSVLYSQVLAEKTAKQMEYNWQTK
jgi:transcriptional regulator GlxA family with amidase domain